VNRRRPLIVACAVVAICFIGPPAVEAQPREDPVRESEREGVLGDAWFDTTFRKYGPPENRFSPYYSWDAEMALSLTVFRKGPRALIFRGVMQAVGTENLGSKVSVGGTGYIIDVGYLRTHSADFALAAGVSHLSSHLTRDLDDKLDEERSKGATIPMVDDPDEYNVPYLRVYRKVPQWPFTPELEVAVEPISFRFHAAPRPHPRPVYVGTRWALWQGAQKFLVARTHHEIGENAFNQLSLNLELFARAQSEGRLQIFVSVSPGNDLHVSPNIGGLRDGIAFGLRIRLRS
jgi:hypothetical protein